MMTINEIRERVGKTNYVAENTRFTNKMIDKKTLQLLENEGYLISWFDDSEDTEEVYVFYKGKPIFNRMQCLEKFS